MTCALCQFDYTDGSEYESKIEQFWESRGDASGRGGPARVYGGTVPVDYNAGTGRQPRKDGGGTPGDDNDAARGRGARDTEYGLGDWARARARVEEIAAADKYDVRLDAARPRAASEQMSRTEYRKLYGAVRRAISGCDAAGKDWIDTTHDCCRTVVRFLRRGGDPKIAQAVWTVTHPNPRKR